MQIRKIIILLALGFLNSVFEVSLINKITWGEHIFDLILLIIYYTMLFVDVTPAIFLICILAFFRDIFTGQYIGANIISSLILYSLFLIFREKFNEEDRYFQIIFTFLMLIFLYLILKLILPSTSMNVFDIILKGGINGLLAPYMFKFIKWIEKLVENVLEKRQIRKYRPS